MKSDHVKHKIPDYLTGTLDDRQKKVLEGHLERCTVCREELAQYETLDLLFEKESVVEPSQDLRKGFEKMLHREIGKNPEKSTFFDYQVLLKIAAVVTLLVLSFEAGRFMEQEGSKVEVVEATPEEGNNEQIAMLSLMTDESASKRIQGVNYFEGFPDLNKEILKVLIDKMLYDNNKNVRLSAVEALGKFSSSDEVKKNLISALKTEKDPLVQISLIQTLVEIQEKEAIEPMKNLLQQEETEPFVKEHIKSLLPSII